MSPIYRPCRTLLPLAALCLTGCGVRNWLPPPAPTPQQVASRPSVVPQIGSGATRPSVVPHLEEQPTPTPFTGEFDGADDVPASDTEPEAPREVSTPTSAPRPIPTRRSEDDETPYPQGPDASVPSRLPVLALAGRSGVTRRTSAAAYRQLGDGCAARQNFACAREAYLREAAIYRERGLSDAAQIQARKASRYDVVAKLYVEQPGPPPSRPLARLEPANGCYLGAFADLAQGVEIFAGDNWQSHASPLAFMKRVGRTHATVFTYATYGTFRDRGGVVHSVFPRRWLLECKRQGVIPHIAWEPGDLRAVRDDAYLRDCAAFLKELDWPVFVRFAGEMNGDWTPYHGEPALYRQKFRLVSQVLRQTAPRVAMIWCPNAIPLDNIESYYPGDDVVDWVGVNLYSVPFLDNDASRPAFKESPVELLDPIYQRYAARKPIAICEYGASHQSAVDGVERPEFAVARLAQLYGALPRLYPRVKLVDWFSCNTLEHARAGRRLNNYDLLLSSPLRAAYKRITGTPYFIKQVQTNRGSRPVLREVQDGRSVPERAKLSLWVQTPVEHPQVLMAVNGRPVLARAGNGGHSIQLDLARLSASGAVDLEIVITDERGRMLRTAKYSARVGLQ